MYQIRCRVGKLTWTSFNIFWLLNVFICPESKLLFWDVSRRSFWLIFNEKRELTEILVGVNDFLLEGILGLFHPKSSMIFGVSPSSVLCIVIKQNHPPLPPQIYNVIWLGCCAWDRDVRLWTFENITFKWAKMQGYLNIMDAVLEKWMNVMKKYLKNHEQTCV